MAYPIRSVPDGDTNWGPDLRDTIAGVNDHQTRISALETGGGSGGGNLNRIVEVNGAYPSRPATGYTDFLGITDPSAFMQTGDTWTQLPPAVPDAPTIGTATGGDARASVAFTAPSWNGGATITGYTATSTPGSLVGTGASSPITVTGLTNGTAYTFTVHATNSAGNSAESAASNSVTPRVLTVPGAPTIGTATAGDSSATVAFTPPADNGGATITGYTATSTPGSFTGTGSSSPVTVSGLANGTAYTFTVHATNSVGNSAESAASNSVTPASLLTDSFTGSNGSAWSTSFWQAPIGTGTFDIQSNQGHASFTSAGSFEEVARKFNVGDGTHWRVRGNLAQLPVTAGWRVKVYLQAASWASTTSPTSGYYLYMDAGGNEIDKRDGFLVLVNTFGPTGPRWFDIKVVSGVISYKVWTGLLTDAPASYSTFTDPTPLTGAGSAGIVFGSTTTAGTMDFRIDDFLIDNNAS
jgi:hypothetical protein